MRTGKPTDPRCSGALLTLTAATVLFAAAGCMGNVGSNATGAGNTSGGAGTTGSGTGTSGTTGAGNVGVGGSVGGTGNPTGAGGAGGAGGTMVSVPSSCAQAGMDTGATVLRRLSNLEYQLTLQDLFQLTAPPALDGIPPDVDHDGFRTYAGIQSVTAQHLRAYIDRAHALGEELMADTARRSRVLGCEPTASGCLRAFVGRFGKLAYRRPLQTVELDGIVNRATADALDANDQFKFAIEVMLSSSNFLYRVEIGNPAEAVTTLTPQELASRLSFALWGRAPDATLIDQATAMLGTPDALLATANAMLANARTKTSYDAFFRQWLGFEGMVAPPNPPAGWTDALVADMTRETQGVIGDFAWANPSRNFLDVLTAGYTRPTAALSTYYGLPTAAADGTAQFPTTHVRAGTGLLTHPSLLAAKRDGDLIAMRGNWLRRTFVCRSLSIDPGVAEMLGELLVGLTRVEIVKKRNTEVACAGCHAQIDPVGIGFVQFDHTGRFDATIDGSEYGVPAALPDAGNARFNTVAELAGKLRALPELSACLSTKVFVYAEGRDPLRADSCALESATKSFTDGGNSFPAMLRGLVASSAFRTRRAAGVTP